MFLPLVYSFSLNSSSPITTCLTFKKTFNKYDYYWGDIVDFMVADFLAELSAYLKIHL